MANASSRDVDGGLALANIYASAYVLSQRSKNSNFKKSAPEIVDFGGSKRPSPSQKPTGASGGEAPHLHQQGTPPGLPNARAAMQQLSFGHI